MPASAFDPGAATAALLRLAGTSLPPSTGADEQRQRARTVFLVWLIGLPAGAEREAARAVRPGLSNLAATPILAEVLQLVDRLLATPECPIRQRRSRSRPRLH